MRFITKCFVVLLCAVAFVVPVYGTEARPLRQTYTIQIRVDCLDTAMEAIHGLPGYNLDSSANFNARSRSASFTRRITNNDLRYVQQALREIGEVITETEAAAHLGARQMDLDVRIAVIDQEFARLASMMEASDTLSVLIAVNDRLSDVARQRDDLIGQRNMLAVQAAGPILNIYVSETITAPPREPEGFWQRVSDNFVSSVSNTIAAAASFLVFIVRWGLSLLIWAVILVVVGRVAWRFVGKKVRNTNTEPNMEESEAEQ